MLYKKSASVWEGCLGTVFQSIHEGTRAGNSAKFPEKFSGGFFGRANFGREILGAGFFLFWGRVLKWGWHVFCFFSTIS